MAIADREFEEAVPKALQLSLDYVSEEGTANKLEWLHKRYAYFLHSSFTVDVGEGASSRRLYALTHVTLSEDSTAIDVLADELRKTIETEY